MYNTLNLNQIYDFVGILNYISTNKNILQFNNLLMQRVRKKCSTGVTEKSPSANIIVFINYFNYHFELYYGFWTLMKYCGFSQVPTDAAALLH